MPKSILGKGAFSLSIGRTKFVSVVQTCALDREGDGHEGITDLGAMLNRFDCGELNRSLKIGIGGDCGGVLWRSDTGCVLCGGILKLVLFHL